MSGVGPWFGPVGVHEFLNDFNDLAYYYYYLLLDKKKKKKRGENKWVDIPLLIRCQPVIVAQRGSLCGEKVVHENIPRNPAASRGKPWTDIWTGFLVQLTELRMGSNNGEKAMKFSMSLAASDVEKLRTIEAWIGSERHCEILRMALRAVHRNLLAERAAGREPVPPDVDPIPLGRRPLTEGEKLKRWRFKQMVWGSHAVWMMSSVAAAKASWERRMVKAGLDPAGTDEEARQWREQWTELEPQIRERLAGLRRDLDDGAREV